MTNDVKKIFSICLMRIGCVAADISVMSLSYLTAFILRFDFKEPSWGWGQVAVSFLVVCVVQICSLSAWGCYRLLWRYMSIGDIPRFVGAVGSATVAFLFLRIFFPEPRWLRPPYSITFFNSFLVLGGLLSIRLLVRCLLEKEFTWNTFNKWQTKRVLLIGAGAAGNLVVRELRRQRGHKRVIVGFLDDDPAKQNAHIQGIRVCGKIEDLPVTVRKRKIDEVIVSMAKVPRNVIRRVVRLCEQTLVPTRIVPGYFELIEGNLSVSNIRDVNVSDLLGREEVSTERQAVIALLARKVVLVTGAGGSIGSEIARQVLRAGPARLLLVERSEFALYEIDRELRAMGSSVPFVSILADITDEDRMADILRQYQPALIIHAAAYKQVPMMEENPAEALKNNVLATRHLGELAIQAGVERFVFISTDKAVRPVSVMGVSKRLGEIVLQDLNRQKKTLFSAVRFGNVLGSSGSVVPLFSEQIRKGGPVTVTHPEMKRYFMTISEAVALVLEASALAKGGEIFVLDMGEPVRIVELAEEMISLSGLRPYEDIPLVFTGIRPGEKLFEELDVSEKSAFKTGHARIFVSRIHEIPADRTAALLDSCRELVTYPGNIAGKRIRALSVAISES